MVVSIVGLLVSVVFFISNVRDLFTTYFVLFARFWLTSVESEFRVFVICVSKCVCGWWFAGVSDIVCIREFVVHVMSFLYYLHDFWSMDIEN